MNNTQRANPANASTEIEVLEYPPCVGGPPVIEWDGWIEAGDAAAGPVHNHAKDGGPASERFAEEARRSFEAGLERGRREGHQAEREAQAAHLAEEEKHRRHQLAQVVARIGEERDRFLDTVEQEVVRLALAIAARILRREAQMDPLLLTGAVRVALGQLAGSAEIRLLVPAAEADLWAETIALLPKLSAKPVVVAAEGMHVGDCMIESKLGTVDLGLRAQLGEIERGFFDRAAASPPSKTAAGTQAAEIAAPPDASPQKESA